MATIFLQRIVVPLGGDLSVSVLLPLAVLSVFYLFAVGAAAIHTASLLACLAFLASAVVSQALGGTDFSMPSLALLLVIYAIFPVEIPISRRNYLRILASYQYSMLFVAFVVAVQYLFQVSGRDMPILEDFLPESIIVKNFNYIQEIFWQSGIYKPNGMFMLEASFLSQFIAIALVTEYWFFRRVTFLLLFGCILVLTFSGTGMALAAISVGLVVWKRGLDKPAIILGSGLAAVLLFLLVSGWFMAISDRIGEFSDPNASGSLRFIAPIERVFETLTDGKIDPLLYGAGAGFIDREVVGFAWWPLTKVWVEYGVIVSFFYWIFLIVVFQRGPSALLTLTLLLEYLFFGGGSLLQPPVVYAVYFLSIGYACSLKERTG